MMNNTNSWKFIKDIFSTPKSSSITLTERKYNRNTQKSVKKVFVHSKLATNLKNEKYTKISIEDSDEENEGERQLVRRKTPTHHSNVLRPLDGIINISKQSSKISDNEDSNDTISHDPDTIESDLCQPTSVHNSSRMNSLDITCIPSRNVFSNICIHPKQQGTPLTGKNHLHKFQNSFDGTVSSLNEKRQLENSILDSDGETNDVPDGLDISKKKNCKQRKINELNIFSNTVVGQSAVNTEYLIDTESSIHSNQIPLSMKENTLPAVSLIPPARSSSRRRVKKGGLVEYFRKTVKRSKSDFSFWLNERESALVPPGEKVEINRVEHTYGRILIHCTSQKDGKIKIICLDPGNKKVSQLNVGRTIEIDLDTTNYYSIDNKTYFFANAFKMLI